MEKENVQNKGYFFHAALLEILRREWDESVSTHGFFFFFCNFRTMNANWQNNL